MPLRETVGWREVGQFFSLTPPVGHEIDQNVLAAIRQFDPDVIPIWVSWVFLPDVKDASSHRPLVVGRHALAYYEPHKPDQFSQHHIAVPANHFGPVPNRLGLILEHGEGETEKPLPGPYQAFDWKLYYFLRSRFARKTEREAVAEFREGQYRKQRAKEKQQEEIFRMQQEFSREAEKILEAMGGDVYHQFEVWKRKQRERKRLYSI